MFCSTMVTVRDAGGLEGCCRLRDSPSERAEAGVDYSNSWYLRRKRTAVTVYTFTSLHRRTVNVQQTLLRTAPFWVITQRVVVTSYRRLGTLEPRGWEVQVEPEDGTDRLSRDVGDNPERRSSQLLRGRSQRSRVTDILLRFPIQSQM
jgi:hypothetical protein